MIRFKAMTIEGRSKLPNEVMPVSSMDLRELSEIYNERDIYLSIYLPTASRNDRSLNGSYVDSRERDIIKTIGKDLMDCFSSTLEMVRDMLDRDPIPGEMGVAIFASKCDGMKLGYRLSAEPERKMVLDTSPFLLPLAKLKDEFEDYGLLLMDSQEARLMIVRSHQIEEEGKASIDLMKRHKKGGMSQMRFNRLRRGAIHAFVTEVIEDLRGMEDLSELRGIVIAGPGNAKGALIKDLPKDIYEMVIGTIDVEMDVSANELVKLSDEIASENERGAEASLVMELKGAIMKGEHASYGESDIIASLEEGRVSTLLILEGVSRPGWICEGCQTLRPKEGPPKKCPKCGGRTSRVDVVEEMFELAERTGARTEFVKDSSFLVSIGGIGAILRY